MTTLTLSRNSRFNVRHNIYMALIQAEYSGMAKSEMLGRETILSLRADAETITDMIASEYLSKQGAGALWLNKRLRDPDWLCEIQERAWEIQRNK